MGQCKYCGDNAGLFRSQHKACRSRYSYGFQQMVDMSAESATGIDFNEASLRKSLAGIAKQSYASNEDIDVAIARGWARSVHDAISDGILTRDEEDGLRDFRDRMSVTDDPAAVDASEDLQRGAEDRLVLAARLAALSTEEGDKHLNAISDSLRESGLTDRQARSMLVRAWETAVQGALEDGVISLDEEHALSLYLHHFDLSSADVNVNGTHTTLVKAGAIRELAQGIIPERQRFSGRVPFNLMKSESLVWVFEGVDYIETVTRRETHGSSQGFSIRVMRGVYYRPSTFRSRTVEWDETGRVDTGLMGLTTKHIYFAGTKKRFRVRYDRIVTFEPYEDGIGIMREAQTAKPQAFITGDGWFAFNLATNLAQM